MTKAQLATLTDHIDIKADKDSTASLTSAKTLQNYVKRKLNNGRLKLATSTTVEMLARN